MGHLHITVDGMAWHWVHAGADPVVVHGLVPGPHEVVLELVDPRHKVLKAQTVSFTVPEKVATASKP